MFWPTTGAIFDVRASCVVERAKTLEDQIEYLLSGTKARGCADGCTSLQGLDIGEINSAHGLESANKYSRSTRNGFVIVERFALPICSSGAVV